ncbi:hypothetical protein, partial [Kingella oralis]|uniref:hypothetical protein n=1 Tax=Kingella oralis TaxID=505 RepID=UPI003C6F3E58
SDGGDGIYLDFANVLACRTGNSLLTIQRQSEIQSTQQKTIWHTPKRFYFFRLPPPPKKLKQTL